jgi:hypothetical protein
MYPISGIQIKLLTALNNIRPLIRKATNCIFSIINSCNIKIRSGLFSAHPVLHLPQSGWRGCKWRRWWRCSLATHLRPRR